MRWTTRSSWLAWRRWYRRSLIACERRLEVVTCVEAKFGLTIRDTKPSDAGSPGQLRSHGCWGGQLSRQAKEKGHRVRVMGGTHIQRDCKCTQEHRKSNRLAKAIRASHGPRMSPQSQATNENSFTASLPQALALASGLESREVRSKRSRLAAVSAALGCVPHGQRAPLGAALPCLCCPAASTSGAEWSPLATVRRRGLVVRSCPRCSLRVALSFLTTAASTLAHNASSSSFFSKCSRSSLVFGSQLRWQYIAVSRCFNSHGTCDSGTA